MTMKQDNDADNTIAQLIILSLPLGQIIQNTDAKMYVNKSLIL